MAERVSYLGLTLSDSHSTQVEMILTNFVVTLMQTEGSTFYRSDTVAQGKQQEQVTKGSKRKNENSKEERPKAKGKKNKEEQTKDDDKATAPDAGDDDDAEDGSDALPW